MKKGHQCKQWCPFLEERKNFLFFFFSSWKKERKDRKIEEEKREILIMEGGGGRVGGVTASLVACICPFLFGYAFGFSSPCLGPIQDAFSLSVQTASFFSSIVLIGALTGCSVGASWPDSKGRRGTILISLAISALGWFLMWLSSVTMSVLLLFVGRFLCGAGLGLSAVVVPIYINEISPKRYQESLGACHQLFITIGILAVYTLGNHLDWIALSLLALSTCVGGIVLVSLCRESNPVKSGKKEGDLPVSSSSSSSSSSSFFTLFKGANRPYVARSVALMFFQQWCGVNIVIFFASVIFSSAGYVSLARSAPVVMALFQVVFTVLSVWMVDKINKKTLLFTGSILMGGSLLLLALFFFLSETEKEIPGSAAVVGLVVFVSAFSISWGPIPWLMIPSILPSHIKGEGASLAILVGYVSSFIIVQSFRSLEEIFGTGSVFVMYSILCFVSSGSVFWI